MKEKNRMEKREKEEKGSLYETEREAKGRPEIREEKKYVKVKGRWD